MVKSVLPCLVIVRRQPVPSLFHPSALPAPSLFAKTANSPYFVFNHFRTLLHSCTPRVLLISFLFFRLRTLCEKQGGVGVFESVWQLGLTLALYCRERRSAGWPTFWSTTRSKLTCCRQR